MTKKEMSSKVANWNRQITKGSEEAEKCFNELQEISKELTGTAHCSAKQNVLSIIACNKDAMQSHKALGLYMKLNVEEGKYEALASFLQETDNFNL